MPITEESKRAYFDAREVFVESYKDFLCKLLGLLFDADASDEYAHAQDDIARFTNEVKVLQSHIEDFGVSSVTSQVSSKEVQSLDFSLQEDRASSPDGNVQPTEPESTEVPQQESGITTALEQKTSPKLKDSTSNDANEEIQVEVESQPSQLSPEPADEAPVILPPPLSDDNRVVSAFCAFRYHKAEFRQLFMRQGSNNSSCYSVVGGGALDKLAAEGVEQSLLSVPPPVWVGPLAQCTLCLMRSAFRDAKPEHWESLKRRLAGFGFRPEVHLALWLRLSSAAADTEAACMDPVDVFNAIPALSILPKRLAAETELMLQTLNLLSQ